MYDYDFGGEAEIFLDIIHCPESYAADKVLEYFAEEEE